MSTQSRLSLTLLVETLVTLPSRASDQKLLRLHALLNSRGPKAPGISPKMSDPKSPVFGRFVRQVFAGFCPALDRVTRNLAVFVLEDDICSKNRGKSDKKSKFSPRRSS